MYNECISKTRLVSQELLTLQGKLAGGSKLGLEVLLEEAASSGFQRKNSSTNEHVMLRWLEARGFIPERGSGRQDRLFRKRNFTNVRVHPCASTSCKYIRTPHPFLGSAPCL